MLWTPLSISHLKSAKLFSELSRKLEDNYDGTSFPSKSYENFSYVTGCIFSSVAFLESNINELLAEAIDGDTSTLRPALTVEEITIVKNLGKKIKSGEIKPKKMSMISAKYKEFLKDLGKEKIDNQLFEDTRLLIQLRNRLVHYEPEWITSNDPDSIHDMEKKLRGKFDESKQYLGTGNPFYPHKCLGSGCAEWSYQTAKAFVDQFYDKLGIRPLY